MRNRRQLRGLSEEVTWVLVQLARAGQIQFSVLVHEWTAIEDGTVESRTGGVRVRTKTDRDLSLSGFFPLTLDQVTDFCLDDPAKLETLTSPDERAVFRLGPHRKVRFLELWAWDADIEAAREVVTALGPFEAFGGPQVERMPTQIAAPKLPPGFLELSVWAHENVPKLVNVDGLRREKVEAQLFQRAKELKLRSPRALAKALWFQTNPDTEGGRPERRGRLKGKRRTI